MRVIAGSARGLKLTAPAGMQTRPTADRVKEALFSIIISRHELLGARILDICAGTGSLGIEALSRGAASCSFIEQDRPVMGILEKNIAKAGLSSKGEYLLLDAIKGLNQLSRQGKNFDIVFFDPPYSSNLYSTIPGLVNTLSLLSDDGLLVAECSARTPLEERYDTLVRVDRRVYGDTALELFIRESP
jgi:16S rRNA (guanine(966)-N(2))-methyltransferase RsmD